MLRPLLFLSALIGLMPGADGLTERVNLTSCPISYYGRTYTEIYSTVSTSEFSVCFTDFYDASNPADCILGSPATSGSLSTGLDSSDSTLQRKIRDDVQTIESDLSCSVYASTSYPGGDIFLFLANFGSEAALRVRSPVPGTLVFNATVNGVTRDTLTYHNNVTGTKHVYLDVSGCRQSGVLYRPGDVIQHTSPETCLKDICNDTAVIQNTGCGDLERCLGNGSCVLDPICTVTGPTIVDFTGSVNSVQDRCQYTLLQVNSDITLSVSGNFLERRRKDVSFLDRVTLTLNGDNIHLEQGGRVLLGNVTLNINSTAQEVGGVLLSKDETGVTAIVTLSITLEAVVFFDGYTAQIQLTGSTGQEISASGLCNSDSLDSARLSGSDSSCEDQYTDTADSNINCTMMTERCDLLREAPFTACHNHTDPQPYITACNDTLCNYPAVDGLYCQFLDAYARACNLRINNTLDDWWTEKRCSPPQALCQDQICSAHEFCGYKANGGTGCFCRAIYAAPYRSTDSLGEPAVCGQDSASVTLAGCLLMDKGVDYTALRLSDPNCTGQIDELNHMVTFSFNSSNTCGTVITTNNSQMMYKNTIVAQNSSSDTITRNGQVLIDFSCFYTLPQNQTMSFRIRDSSVVKEITSVSWNYTLTMNAYTDAALTQTVEPSTEVNLDQKIWVELDTDGLEGGFVAVVTDSCWASTQSSPSAIPTYDLIIDGCPNPDDDSVQVMGNGQGTSNSFSFNMFQFTGNSSEVYLHCQIHLCANENASCAPICNGIGRKRRSARMKYVDEAPAFISMTWTK